MVAWTFSSLQAATRTAINTALGTDGTTVSDSATTALGAIGAQNNNNAFTSTSVVANADGSVLERLEYLQAGQSGTVGIASFPAAAAAANDVSLAEVIRYISENQLPRVVSKAVTFTAAAYEVSTAVAVFTVTGDVLVTRAYGIVGTAIEADTGNDGTISLGVEDSVAALIAATTVNETNFAAADVWTDNSTAQADAVAQTGGVVIANGEAIEINVLTEDITAGTMTLYIEYRPVSSDGAVAAA